jgi:hypothetical protein
MRNILKILSLIYVLVVVTGCETDTDVEPPKFVKKPSINCFLCPEDQNIYAELCYTSPYFGVLPDTDDYILDANVKLFDLTESDSAVLFLSNSSGVYKTTQNQIKIKENHQYELVVETSDGKVHKAQSIVPPKLDLSQVKFTYLKVGAPILDSNGRGGGGPGGTYEKNPFTVEFYYTGALSKDFFINPQFEAEMINKSKQIIPVEMMGRGKEDFYQGTAENSIRVYSNREFNSGFGIDGPFEVNSIGGTLYSVDLAYRNFYISQGNANYSDNIFNEPLMMISNWSKDAIGFFGSYNFVTGEVYRK